ncbi:MAG: sugar transferase [Epulopiscium sp.]|nr:sugar transferase [Candidatus Epulonipiscium sp.]
MVKRLFDIFFSFSGLLLLSVFFLIIAIAIKIDSRGPIFYRQIRVGKDGKKFRIFKFRTMVEDAETKGLQITVEKDNRITKVGGFLRKHKIDELTQLINVLQGAMSLVGPRPEVPKYVSLYTEEQREVLKVKPGITDYASILYKNENILLASSEEPEKMYIHEIMPKKIELNMRYIKDISIWNDIKIIFKTIVVLL